MGAHARPRNRIRCAAMGVAAAGFALTAAGLTAAAIDGSGPPADGRYAGGPVNLSGDGLGTPVPVADVDLLGIDANPGTLTPSSAGTLPGPAGPATVRGGGLPATGGAPAPVAASPVRRAVGRHRAPTPVSTPVSTLPSTVMGTLSDPVGTVTSTAGTLTSTVGTLSSTADSTVGGVVTTVANLL